MQYVLKDRNHAAQETAVLDTTAGGRNHAAHGHVHRIQLNGDTNTAIVRAAVVGGLGVGVVDDGRWLWTDKAGNCWLEWPAEAATLANKQQNGG